MSDWKQDKLEDLPITFVDGDRSSKYPKRDEFVEFGIAFLNAESIKDGFINMKAVNFITEEKYKTIIKGRIASGDLILTTRGNGLGNVAYYKGNPKKGLINAQMLIVRTDNNKLDSRFLFYAFSNSEYQSQLWNFASGSAQPQLPIRDLKMSELIYPPLQVQHKIAAVLSAYDDAIENNMRRIALLEEAAQALYREWFVEFRYPGHEDVPLMESDLGMIPQGWEVCTFGKLVNHHSDGLEPSKTPTEVFEHFSIPAFDEAKRPIFERGDEIRSRKYIVPNDVILLSKINPRIHRIWLPSPNISYRSIASTEFLIYSADSPITLSYLYVMCSNIEFGRTLQSLTGGTSTSHQRVKVKALSNMKIILPIEPLIQSFDFHVTPTLEQIQTLRNANAVLREARDALLPRLVAGEVDISALDVV